jgi:hypothetical protein
MDEQNNTTNEMKMNLGGTKSVVFSFDTTGSMSPCIAQANRPPCTKASQSSLTASSGKGLN